MKVVKAVFVPAHISGFFRPFILKSPDRSGSLNCGPCLDKGVFTEVAVQPSQKTIVRTFIDGKPTRAPTTETVAGHILSRVKGSYSIKIRHRCQVSVGAGYGASGAGALGAALGLSAALGLKMRKEEILRTAHIAEVTCRTGLGDVGAQVRGGLVMTVSPGAPPHGRWKRIAVPENLRVVCATLGGISTRRILENRTILRRVIVAGRKAFDRVNAKPTVKEFLAASRDFMEGSGLAGNDLLELVNLAEDSGAIGASQVMLGRSIFAFCKPAASNHLLQTIRKNRPEAYPTVAKIYMHRCRNF